MNIGGTILFGVAATAATLTFVNTLIGTAIGVVSLGIVVLKFFRNWKHRKDPPTDK